MKILDGEARVSLKELIKNCRVAFNKDLTDDEIHKAITDEIGFSQIYINPLVKDEHQGWKKICRDKFAELTPHGFSENYNVPLDEVEKEYSKIAKEKK